MENTFMQRVRDAPLRLLYFARARRHRNGLVVVGLAMLCMFGLWKFMLQDELRNAASWRGYSMLPGSQLHFPSHFGSLQPSSNQSEGYSKPHDAAFVFHLLIPATTSNSKLCKTVLSSTILNYPPATLVNWNKTFDEGNGKGGSHVGKIRGVLNYLSDPGQVRENDMVLMIDGYDVWFQLPPETMIQRYQQALESANSRNLKRFGTDLQKLNASSTKHHYTKPKFEQKIFFGADKGCWPNALGSSACADVPPSPLPANSWGPDTDLNPQAWLNRPKYLNSGTVIGRASALRAMYERAAYKVEEQDAGQYGDQGVFAEIFGEQEYMRKEYRKSQRGVGTRLLDWMKETFGPEERDPIASVDREKNQTTTRMNWTANPDFNYEFGIGLDYEMNMFQAISMAWEDVEFVQYSDKGSIDAAMNKQPGMPQPQLRLSPDIFRTPGPFRLHSSVNNTMSPLSSSLDILPADNTSWADCPLATNIRVPSVPVSLHFNGFKDFLSEWWPRMWFHSYARALLRRYVRTPPDLSTWDYRGGKGGVWTTEKTFLSWHDLCAGYEEEVFGDGKGPWGKEEGPVKVYNAFGKLIAGEDEEEGQ